MKTIDFFELEVRDPASQPARWGICHEGICRRRSRRRSRVRASARPMASALSSRDLRVQIIRTQAISDATPQIGVASSSSRVSPTFVVPVARRPDAGGSGVLLVGAREQRGLGDRRCCSNAQLSERSGSNKRLGATSAAVCQNDNERFQGVVGGSNPAAPTSPSIRRAQTTDP